MISGLNGFWDSIKKFAKGIVVGIGISIGGPLGGLAAAGIFNLLHDVLDGGGFQWGFGGSGGSGGGWGGIGMFAPVQSAPGNLDVTVSYDVKVYLKKFESWFVHISKGLSGSESKSLVVSDEYRKTVNDVLKKLESYRIYLQVKKNESSAVGLNGFTEGDANRLLRSRKWKDKEDLVNAFKKGVWDAYIGTLENYGVTAYAKTINFTAPKSDHNRFIEPFDWDQSKNYTSELLVFTDASEGSPATPLYEIEVSELDKPVVEKPSVKELVKAIKHKKLGNVLEAKQSAVSQTGKPKTPSNPSATTNPTATTDPKQPGTTNVDQPVTVPDESKKTAIFGLPKPFVYAISGAVLLKFLSK